MHDFSIRDTNEDLIVDVSVDQNSLIRAIEVALEHQTDLSGVSLQACCLDGLSAINARLKKGNFAQSSLVGANFNGADLRGTSFAFADLTKVEFSGALIDLETDFTGAILTGSVYETNNDMAATT